MQDEYIKAIEKIQMNKDRKIETLKYLRQLIKYPCKRGFVF